MYYACDNILYFFHYHLFYSFVFYKVSYIENKYHLYEVHWHQHARGGSLGDTIYDLYGESTNKTGERVWKALFVKKQLKLIFNIPRFTIAYANMTVFSLKFIR